MSTGTPKTLKEAVLNASKAAALVNRQGFAGAGFTPAGVAMLCELHVRDFLAQKFGAAFLKAGDNAELLDFVTDLWKEISEK